MRLIVILFVALVSLPAWAGIGWTAYDNARFGYRGAVPAGFSGYGESENGDGQIFDQPRSQQVLSYWGSVMDDADFAAAVAAVQANSEQQGWAIAFQSVTPDWASFTGVMGQRRFHTRMILLCDRSSVATMVLQYGAAQAADVRPVVDELEAGLVATGC